jgi:hypothetical protein
LARRHSLCSSRLGSQNSLFSSFLWRSSEHFRLH